MDLIHKTTRLMNKPVAVPRKVQITMRVVGLCILGAVFSGTVYNTLARQFHWKLNQEKQAANRAIDKTTDFGRIIINDQGKIISWNKGMTDIAGWTSKEMRGGTIDRIIPADEQLAFKQAAEVVDDPWPWSHINIKTSQGNTIPVRVRVREVADKSGGGSGNFQFLTVDRIPEHEILPASTPPQSVASPVLNEEEKEAMQQSHS